jgi:hypothetical protein
LLFVYLIFGTRGMGLMVAGAAVGGTAVAVLYAPRFSPIGAALGLALGAASFFWSSRQSAGEVDEE